MLRFDGASGVTRTPDLLITKPIPAASYCSARVSMRFLSKISRSGNLFRVPLPHHFSRRSATWVIVWVWFFKGPYDTAKGSKKAFSDAGRDMAAPVYDGPLSAPGTACNSTSNRI